MNEKKLMEQIKKSADNIEAPDSLTPEKIKENLKGTKPAKRKLPIYQMGAVAAVLLIAFVVVWQVRHIEVPGTGNSNEEITAETAADGIPDVMTEAALEESAEELEEVQYTNDQRDVLSPITSEDELYTALAALEDQDKTGLMRSKSDNGAAADVADEMVAEDVDLGTGTVTMETEAAHSETNLQEAGVDEGDIVKTDGKYLYVLKVNGEVRIIEANNGKMRETADIELADKNMTIHEMYLGKDKLFLIGSGSESTMEEEEADIYYINQQVYTRLYTYDITDRKNPKLAGTAEQDGNYRTSRINGDYVYLFTEYTPLVKESKDASTLMPKIGNEKILIDDIFMPGYLNHPEYLVVSSVNIKEPDKIADKKAIVSAAEMFYVSTENIYICTTDYKSGRETTQIIKFSYQNGMISARAVGEVDGYLNDSFSLNESNGYLRVVSTEWGNEETLNHLFVLDESMKIIGTIKSLAPGETIRSARFFGDAGYFVTFRDMDPLFSVDLSDPKNPKVLGELKVTGFSSYLHFYGENKLLGIGNEVDPETGEYKGIKLSMFDISNPADVKEVDKYVIKDTYDMPGLYNYKAIMINPEKNIFGFVCDRNYMVFSYEKDKGFVNEFLFEIVKDDDWSYYENTRGAYIGKVFYLIEDKGIKAFNMEKEYEQIEVFEF